TDSVDAATDSNSCGFTCLPGGVTGLVPDRLTVRSNCIDVLPGNSGFCNRGNRCVREPAAEIEVESRVFGRCRAVNCIDEPLTLRGCVVVRYETDKLRRNAPIVFSKASHRCR